MSGKASLPSLVMVGTVHRDPRGPEKLLRVLDREAPDFITVEISPYALEFRAKRAAGLREALRENLRKLRDEERDSFRKLVSGGGIQGIFLLLLVPFEWTAAEAHAGRRRIGLKPIDLSSYAAEKLSRVSELVRLQNLKALADDPQPPLAEQVRRQYERARALWSSTGAGAFAAEEVQDREEHMAGEIRRVMEENPKGKTLHIGGWEHLVPSFPGPSLFARLKDVNPRRLLLGEEA
jgi:hypothetical protein